jgi:hypothetical protein
MLQRSAHHFSALADHRAEARGSALALPLFEADRDDRIFARSNAAPFQKHCDEVVARCNEREKSIYAHSPIFSLNS